MTLIIKSVVFVVSFSVFDRCFVVFACFTLFCFCVF